MRIRTEKKLSRLLITAALLAPLALPVQAEFIERKITAPNVTPTILAQAPFSIIAEEAIVADLRGPSNVKDITLTVNNNNRLVIRNNTVRKFSDLNLIIDGTGIAIEHVIQPRTVITLALSNIELSADTKLGRLEPYGVYFPSANGFNASVEKDIWVEVYADVQRNMMKFYSRAETYDLFRNYFWSERDESLSSTLGKWHKTATYDIPKNYRKAHKASGLASGSWLALASYRLDRPYTVTDYVYSGHYGTFSHEYGHTMGFKHGSGIAYGWDDPVRAELQKLIENGTVNRVASGDEPTRHDVDFFLHFDEKSGLQLFQKADADFTGIDWINVVYNDETIALSETRIEGNKVKFDVAKTTEDKILFNARFTDQEFMANLTYQTNDHDIISLGSTSIFIPELGDNINSGIIIDPTTGATGPTQVTSVRGAEPTAFTFPVTSESGETITINATGRTYYPGCVWKQLENSAGCTRQQSSDINLNIVVNKEDNPALVTGNYSGIVALHQVSYNDIDHAVVHQVPVEISIFADPTPAKFAEEQAQHEQQRLELTTQLPALEGAIYGSTNSEDAFTFDVNGTEQTLCYFHAVDKDLSKTSLLGFVKDNTCTIGELNSYKGTVGFSSEHYLTFNKYTMNQQGDNVFITLPETGESKQICYRTDEPWIGVGFATGRHCGANMTANNGKAWSFSSTNSFLTNQRDTLDSLPDDAGWVLPLADVTPLTVTFDEGERIICRMSILETQLLGYIDEGKCTIGEHNTWKGVTGFGSYQYQIVDENANRMVENVKVTIAANKLQAEVQTYPVCYRPEAMFGGVGYSTSRSRCTQFEQQVIDVEGDSWKFGYLSGSPKVTWSYKLSTDDIWLSPSLSQLAVKFPTSKGDKVLCRFKANNNAHYGLVNAENACEIGAGRSLSGIDNFNSNDYQVIAANVGTIGESISFNHDNNTQAQLCSRGDYVGYSLNGSRCEQAQVLAENGRRWKYSKGNQMMQYTYQFPEDNAWVFPEQSVTNLTVPTQNGEASICRTHFNNRTVMGFVLNNQCKIDDRLDIEGNIGYANEHYQVIDTSLGNSGQPVTVTWEDGVNREICYRSDTQWEGVGFRGNNANLCQSNLGTDNDAIFFFSSGNTMVIFP